MGSSQDEREIGDAKTADAGDEFADTRELRIEQEQRKQEESAAAADAELPDESDQHRRRAAKAAYLESKLADRERSERNSR